VRHPARPWAVAAIVAMPADQQPVVGELARRGDDVEHQLTVDGLRAVEEPARRRLAQRALQLGRPGPDDRGVTLVGGSVRIALETRAAAPAPS